MDRESDGKVGGELLDELFSAFEDLETQSAGLLQFLKAKGLATDEELAPYLHQAADASNVRWLAGRLRMEALLAAAIKDAEEEFVRKAEERARAQDKSSAEKKEARGESEKKAAAKDPGTGSRNPDARDEESPWQARGPKAEANSEAEEGADDRKQVAKAPN
jgi:hypothetical protein